MTLNLTPNHFLHNEESLRSKIVTNLGTNACRVYNILNEDIRRTDGLVRDAVAKIVIRDMRLSASLPFGRKNYQENLHYIYIWPDLQTTKLPDKYQAEINEWLGELRGKYAAADTSADTSADTTADAE
jgi:hypothetical protein